MLKNRLEFLDLSNNGLTNKGLVSILDNLTAYSTLKTLYVQQNSFTIVGLINCVEYFEKGIKLKTFSVGVVTDINE